MIEFQVNDMTCGHCVSTVTRAAKSVDPEAKVEVDLPARRVRIAADLPPEAFAQAIRDAGYTPAAAAR